VASVLDRVVVWVDAMKMVHYRLSVTLSRGPRRLAADRKLNRLVHTVGLRHLNEREAEEACALISGAGALVSSVALTRVTEEPKGVWRKGKRS
jgi:hypothetical protein